ncbi:unnamed protein product [Sphagnum jensenii]|uniref:NADH-ubiquinone oxidoreductase ESSS subunit n=1 Tax=Sphagnum jensenii TaxID=128206 RepID=A0ABP1AHR1_9BRYO
MVWTIPVGIKHFQAVVTVSFESKLQSSLLFLLFDVCTRTLFLLLFTACWKKRERERERERVVAIKLLLPLFISFLGFEWFGPDTQERHHGVLFNETPPPPKQKMKWEDSELPDYGTGIMAVVLLAVGLSTKPDTRIETWARKQALERLAAEEEE